MTQSEYIPGVCNIGPEEINRRRNFGWITLVISLALLAALIWLSANPWWRLFVFFPVTLSSFGFLQAHFEFCAGFARNGSFNFGQLGSKHQITNNTSKSKDRKQGNRITLSAVLIGVIVAVVSVLV